MHTEQITYFIAQWQDSSGAWRESAGFGRDDENQQAHYAKAAGIDQPHSGEAAVTFARVLQDAKFTVRVIRRIENVTAYVI